MKTRPITTALLVTALAGPALATQQQQIDKHAKVIACFKKDYVEATYEVTYTKVQDAVRRYVARNGRIELLEFPPVYREDKTLKKEAHYVMREIPCN